MDNHLNTIWSTIKSKSIDNVIYPILEYPVWTYLEPLVLDKFFQSVCDNKAAVFINAGHIS